MKRQKVDLPREIYEFPEGQIKLVNWKEVVPMELGNWAGLHGNMETELIICRETAGSKQTVMGRSVFFPGAFHDPHFHSFAEEFIYCLSGKGVTGGGDKEYQFTPGDTQYAGIGEIHWLRNPFDEPLEFIWVYTGCATPDESGYATCDLFDEANTVIKKNNIPK
jgi:quercetin dioxygenase-like cupin family protein